jgi:hypothetical protein
LQNPFLQALAGTSFGRSSKATKNRIFTKTIFTTIGAMISVINPNFDSLNRFIVIHNTTFQNENNTY